MIKVGTNNRERSKKGKEEADHQTCFFKIEFRFKITSCLSTRLYDDTIDAYHSIWQVSFIKIKFRKIRDGNLSKKFLYPLTTR